MAKKADKYAAFHFRQFELRQARAAMKMGTDAMIFGALLPALPAGACALDIGAGTGVLSLMLMQRSAQNSRITALEPETGAFEDCKENVEASPWRAQLRVHNCAMQAYRPNEKFDLIFSNPPYYPANANMARPDTQRRMARAQDSLRPEELLEYAGKWLKPDGELWWIAPPDYLQDMQNGWQQGSLTRKERYRVFSFGKGEAPVRLISSFQRQESPVVCQDIILYAKPGCYSQQYQQLTSAYHLKQTAQ